MCTREIGCSSPSTLVQCRSKKSPTQPKIKPRKISKPLNELDIRCNKLIAESVDRTTSLERVIQIKKELTELRRLKRGKKLKERHI